MAAHPGPSVNQPRTLRGRALDPGTDPKGFTDSALCPVCGMEHIPGIPVQHYSEPAGVEKTIGNTSPAAEPVGAPFVVKGA